MVSGDVRNNDATLERLSVAALRLSLIIREPTYRRVNVSVGAPVIDSAIDRIWLSVCEIESAGIKTDSVDMRAPIYVLAIVSAGIVIDSETLIIAARDLATLSIGILIISPIVR